MYNVYILNIQITISNMFLTDFIFYGVSYCIYKTMVMGYV